MLVGHNPQVCDERQESIEFLENATSGFLCGRASGHASCVGCTPSAGLASRAPESRHAAVVLHPQESSHGWGSGQSNRGTSGRSFSLQITEVIHLITIYKCIAHEAACPAGNGCAPASCRELGASASHPPPDPSNCSRIVSAVSIASLMEAESTLNRKAR